MQRFSPGNSIEESPVIQEINTEPIPVLLPVSPVPSPVSQQPPLVQRIAKNFLMQMAAMVAVDALLFMLLAILKFEFTYKLFIAGGLLLTTGGVLVGLLYMRHRGQNS